MAWTYCKNCDAPLAEPSLSDAVIGERECPHCHHSDEVPEFDRRCILDYLEDRLNADE